MKIVRVLLAVAATGGILFGAAAAAPASTSYSTYNTTIGRFGGSGYSGTQTKTIADQDAEVVSSTVGGSYTADVCVAGGSLCIGGTKTINDGTKVALWNLGGQSATVRLKFTDGFQWVNVQVNGKWRADKV